MKKAHQKIGKKHRALRVLSFGVVSVGLAFLLLVGALALYSAVWLSPEEDERLFREAGGDSFTRFYYSESGGTPVDALSDYEAKEWESERLSADEKCIYTPIDEMSPHLADAFVAIEDHRFYKHRGVDILRSGKAVLNSVFHFTSRFGGSTITQQLIKNIGGEKEQSATRKMREMLRAWSLERRHTKREILEAYLNIVPMSGNCLGVGAGSLLYFNKTPAELTLAEAASVAAITRAPAVYAPEKNPEKHLERRNLVLRRMLECGMIDGDAYRAAVEEPLSLENGLTQTGTARSWYTERVIDDVKEGLLSKGYTEAAARALIYRGGLKIYTAVDIEAQRTAEAYFEGKEGFAGYDDGLIASFVLLGRDGRLAALIGNRGPKAADRLLNHATDALYAPGSALKPVALYAPAVDEGKITEATVFDDVPDSFSASGAWPRNAPDVYAGLTPCTEALALSKNTAAVSLYRMLGAEHIYATLSSLGIDTLVRRRTVADGKVLTDLAPAPLALGELTDGVSLLALTRAYLPLFDEGRLHTVRSYLLVLDRDGNVLLAPKDEPSEVFSEQTASVLTHMLTRVTEEGSADTLTLPEMVPTAGKTGTSGGGKNRLFIGYTPYYLGGVLCSYGDGRAVTGTVHLAAFDGVMRAIHQGIDEREERGFPMAKGLRAVRLCRDSGEQLSPLCRLDARGCREMTVWLPEESIPKAKCSVHTEAWYDEEGDGVVTDPSLYAGRPLKRVSLLKIEGRAFPLDIAVSDAEYTARDLGGVLPAKGDLAYYASLLPDGVYAGRRADGARPYNALAREPLKTEEAPKPKDEEQRDTPPLKEKRERIRGKARRPWQRFFDLFS